MPLKQRCCEFLVREFRTGGWFTASLGMRSCRRRDRPESGKVSLWGTLLVCEHTNFTITLQIEKCQV
ncbi:hypothetical protein [Tychonema sp. LEGE 07203]|uniref:hypothetical protein n=1 Tax=Tychonema sp. LEGE 07203 TaxID=1828671 RepID=UPI001881B3C1|nr:hypothetical protein [Tychonema sp. LEGE 07203]MBE9094497.1 hypothetical protein [Tychonema sp. LEGE 07203]